MTSRSPTITKLKNKNGMMLETMDYGARLCRLRIPLNDGYRDVVLRYAQPDDYLCDPFYVGACIGRHAGRIANAEISLNEQVFRLDKNEADRENCLHGGRDGFSQCFWQRKVVSNDSIEYALVSQHEDQGFPGTMHCSVIYSIAQNAEFSIVFHAKSDQDTVLNLAHHAYYNLDGNTEPGQSTIASHQLLLPWTRFVPLNARMLPLADSNSELIEQLGITPNIYQPVRDLLAHTGLQTVPTGGLDHYMLTPRNCANRPVHDAHALDACDLSLQHAATLRSADTRVTMHVHTTQPGAHVYTGNFLGAPWRKHQGISFETQGLPNGFEQSSTPANLLCKNTQYTHITNFTFECQ